LWMSVAAFDASSGPPFCVQTALRTVLQTRSQTGLRNRKRRKVEKTCDKCLE
jgi:hypothetical protein